MGSGVKDLAWDGCIDGEELEAVLKAALVTAIEEASADRLLSDRDDARVAAICAACNLSPDDLGPATDSLFKARVLRGLNVGKLIKVPIKSDVLLQPGDFPVWEFNYVRFLTTQNRVQYVGGSHGVSIRVARGVYYRRSAFRGERIITEDIVEKGIGTLVVAFSNLYFVAPHAHMALRLPFRKILAVHAYSDGIEVLSDGSNQRPNIFKLDDPVFASNLISYLHH